jgi:hypothetical protein
MSKQKDLGTAVREQGGLKKTTGTMSELVFDPVTGEFVVKDKGAALSEGEEVVTEMTNNGFAANIGHMTSERYEAEVGVLKKKLPPNAYRFMEDNGRNYLLMAARTNCGNIYTIWIDLNDFPENIPCAGVTKMLKSKDGRNLDSASADMHTLTSMYGGTRICHYGANEWTPMVSLFKIYMKNRLWLEIYDSYHLKTGKPIDYYLPHAS